jgi:AraC-like DNA-binding protein
MEKVLSLLSSEEFSVKEIAALSGFADEKYLSRIFKKKYGVPPSVMKRKSVI